MAGLLPKQPAGENAIILAASRRQAKLFFNQKIIECPIPRKFSELLPGDQVQFIDDNLCSILPRKNVFKRSLGERSKEILANIDRLFIVTAPPPLFNPSVIDRIIIAAQSEGIPVRILCHKCDLETQSIQASLRYYQLLGIDTAYTSIKNEEAKDRLNKAVEDGTKQIAVAGVSGAGKSSILKHLIPDIQIRTMDVSIKTGQGRQTTSRVEGYVMPKTEQIIFDVPGIQNFGLTHLSIEEIRDSFLEFANFPCPYSDCRHLKEQECAVKLAVAKGEILPSRYNSYQQIITEINTNHEHGSLQSWQIANKQKRNFKKNK